MSETVVVGEQTFIKTDKGWIDKKSKAPAPAALLEIIDLFPREEDNRLTNIIQKIGRKPIELGSDKYIFDAKKNVWLNSKTKKPADDFIQTIIKETYEKVEKGSTQSVTKSYGMAAAASKVKNKKPQTISAGETSVRVTPETLAINTAVVKMIGALASIDAFLSQKLQNQKIQARNAQLSYNEAQIEQKNEKEQIQLKQKDAEKEGGPGLGLLALGGLGLLAFDPVREGIASLANGIVGVAKFVGDILSGLNNVLKFLIPDGVKSIPEDTLENEKTDVGRFNLGLPGGDSPQAEPNQPPPPNTPDAEPVPNRTLGGFSSAVISGAITGGSIGAGVGAISGGIPAAITTPVGALAGATVAAAAYYFDTKPAAPASAPSATSVEASPVTPGTTAKPGTISGTPLGVNLLQNADGQTPSLLKQVATGDAQKQQNVIPKAGDSIVPLGKYLQGLGYKISEHPEFGGVTPPEVAGRKPTSRHYKGKAIDINIVPGDDSKDPRAAAIFDQLKPLLEAAGYSVLWREDGHYDHMHVSIGGPEGSGDGESYGLNNLIGDSFNAVAETFGKLSGIFIQPGVPRDDIPGMITDTAIKTNAAVVESKEIQLPKTATIITPPNINRNSEGPAQAPATSTDTESITYYLRRFAMQDISTPIIALKPAMAK